MNPSVSYVYLPNRVPALAYRFTEEQFNQLKSEGVLAGGNHSQLIEGQVLVDGLPRRFTGEEFEQMARTGMLSEDHRIELLDGYLVFMSPIGYRHAQTVSLLNRFFSRRANDRYEVSILNPIEISETMRPQPDVVLVRPEAIRRAGHPRPADVLLLIEVADSSIDLDQSTKLPIYAQVDIAEFWIVNLLDDTIEIHRRPAFDHYEERNVVHRDEMANCAVIADLVVPVNEILP